MSRQPPATCTDDLAPTLPLEAAGAHSPRATAAKPPDSVVPEVQLKDGGKE